MAMMMVGLALVLLGALGGSAKFSFPLKMSPALVSQPRPVSPAPQKDIVGLSLASDPSGKINFMAMVDNLEGDSGRGYYLELIIGTPPQTLNILVDTGSSNFAVAGASNPYITSYYLSERSKTYRPLNLDVTVRYTQGSWTGVLGQDVVTLPKGLNGTFLVNIASILESESFFMPDIKWQGILGLAYRALAKPSSAIDTFFDSLVEQQKIPNIFSMQMCGAGRPTTLTDSNGGSLVMGGMEPSLYRGEIWYTPITEEWYYQVEVLKFEVGGQNLNLDCTEVFEYNKEHLLVKDVVTVVIWDALVIRWGDVFIRFRLLSQEESRGQPPSYAVMMTSRKGINGRYNLDKAIVDSGTTLLRLPDKVFNAVVDGIIQTSLIENFNNEFWTGLQLACWEKNEKPWAYFPDLSIYLRDVNLSESFRLTIKPQLYIQSVVTSRTDLSCYRFGISPSSNALVIGATVMEGFYVVFDREEKRVGFATSSCAVVGDVMASEISGPFSTVDISSNCIASNPLREPIMWIISYTLMTFCGIVLLVLVVLLLLPNRRHINDPEVVNDESSLVRHRWK